MSADTVPAHRRGRSTAAIVVEFLGSMSLAVTLLVAVAVASIIGTVLQQNQPYQDYLIKFGPFWHEVFKALGLYDVYSASWFLIILGFLVVSTTVCVYRQTPMMLREMRHYRLGVQEKSLRAFHQKREGETARGPRELAELGCRALEAQGYRVRARIEDDHAVVAAMKGGLNRLGYLLTHVAIVVICLGGLMDGKLPIKLAELAGTLRPETRNIPASEVPAISRVSVNNFSFRGSVDVPEGQRANLVFLPLRDGYLVQPLPFAVEVKDFRVEHYATGQPKSFESDLVIHDPEREEPLEATIAVNHPLIYKGYAIYQASFGDGGSELSLRLWPLQPGVRGGEVKVEVFGSYRLQTPAGPLRLEPTDFRLFNINPMTDASGETRNVNLGPSFTFRLRDEAGEAREFVNYMNPVERDGHYYFISGVRDSVAEPFSYLHIPMDPQGGVGRFMRFLAHLQDPALVREVAEETTRRAMARTRLQDEDIKQQVAESMVRLVTTFAAGGFEAVAAQVEEHIPEDQQQEAAEAIMRVLNTGLQAIYRRVLAEDGVGEPEEDDWRFFEDAVTAVAALPFYGTPYYLQLSEFKQVQASGLQISKSPGKNVVYAGSLMLVVGVFLLFYVAHRRVWLWVKPDGRGSRYLLAGTSNRHALEFERHFAALSARLEQVFAAPPGKEKVN